MSLFRREERRAVSFQDFWGSGGPAPNATITADRALRLAPVYAATRLLADEVAALPIQVFRRKQDGSRERVDTPAALANPSAIGTPFDWKHRCMTSLLLQGNAYGLRIADDGRTEWLAPGEVDIDETNPLAPIFYVSGRQIDRQDLLHIPAYTLAGKVKGLTPLGAFSLAVQLGYSATEFGRDWFQNRVLPGGTLKNSAQTVTPEQASEIKARFRATMRAGETFVHGSDWDYKPVGIKPEDSQLVDVLKLTATQVASVYGVPPEMIGGESGGTLTYNTVEQHTISLLTHTLRPWLIRLEDAFAALLPVDQGFYVKFNVDSLVRTDLEARYKAHKIAREIGLNNIDELREVEDLAPLPNGEGQDYTPLNTAGRREGSE